MDLFSVFYYSILILWYLFIFFFDKFVISREFIKGELVCVLKFLLI